MKFKVLVRPESQGGFSVSVPALPGCYSEGETREEAITKIREAAELWLQVSPGSVELLSIQCSDGDDDAGVHWAEGIGHEWQVELSDSRPDIYTAEDGYPNDCPR